MSIWRGLIFAVAIEIPHLICAQQTNDGEALSRKYSAAFYTPGGAGLNQQRLVVFPVDGQAFSLPLPFPLWAYAVSADGEVLWAAGWPDGVDLGSPRLYRIEFNPTRISPVLGSSGPNPIFSVVVSESQDKIVFSAKYRLTAEMGCGIFELAVSRGKVRRILDSPGCLSFPNGSLSAWRSVSLSPNGEKAVAIRKGRLQLVDLATSTAKEHNEFGDRLYQAAWSPSGAWIAAAEQDRKERTILIDTSSFAKRRTQANTTTEWSPDSRFLLGWKQNDKCGYNVRTLEAVNINNGKRTTIESSSCKVPDVNEGTPMWISSEIRK
jgi:WD40 repeat protein